MATILYRLSGNEVVKISESNQLFGDRDSQFWGTKEEVADSLTFPDGRTVRDINPNNTLGPLRVLGFSKILDGTTIRNATQPEIDGFSSFESSDENQLDANHVDALVSTHPLWRKVVKSLLKGIIREDGVSFDKHNEVVSQWEQFKADVANANNLGDIKTSVSQMPPISNAPPQRTLQQAITFLKSDIDPGD